MILREHSVAVAYLANQAWEACMQPELAEIATSLLVLQERNEKEQSQQLTVKINAVRNIIPFDAMALFEDVWRAPTY